MYRRATNEHAKIFAGYELTEAIAVTTVLKDLGTAEPPINNKGKAMLEKIQPATGKEFDLAYIQAQKENHEYLRDLAEGYLANSDANKADPAEAHGRHLATLTSGLLEARRHYDKELGGAAGLVGSRKRRPGYSR